MTFERGGSRVCNHGTAEYAQKTWDWLKNAKHIRYRVSPVGGPCASEAQREVLSSLEAWEPLQLEEARPNAGGVGGGLATAAMTTSFSLPSLYLCSSNANTA